MAWHLTSSPEIGRWVAAQMDGHFSEANSNAIGMIRDGKIVAGVIYENCNGQSVVCHLAIAGQVNKSFLRITTGFAFDALGVKKIIGPISSANTKSIKAAKTTGFVEEARITNAAPNGDIILFTMTAKQCRFLGERHG